MDENYLKVNRKDLDEKTSVKIFERSVGKKGRRLSFNQSLNVLLIVSCESNVFYKTATQRD